ncbi:MAG: PEP-CTERM sorting domain-containing protein [Chthoniobacterales bacterium]
MTSPHRLGLAAALTLLLTLTAKADLLISNFDNFAIQLFPPMGISWNGGSPASDQYIQGAGFISITPVNGGNPKGDGYFLAGLNPSPGVTSLNFTGLNFFSINARVDAGNASSIFHVQLFDSTLTPAAVGTFSAASFTSSFSTHTTPLVVSGGGDLAAIMFWRMDGDGIAGDNFRFSYGNLAATTAAVPEPSTYAIGAIALLGLCIVRREIRKRSLVQR